jgi:subtilisin family serine protease
LPLGIELADLRFGGGYLYQARQLLVTRDDLNLLRRLLQEGRIHLAPGEPQPIDGTRLVRVFLHPDERKTVPEVVSILRAIDLEDRPVVQVFPNHVLVGAPKAKTWASGSPRPNPVDSPRAADPLADPPANGGQPGAGVRVAVLDSGVVAGHPWLNGRAVPLDAASDVEQPELENGALKHSSGHGTFVAGVVLQCAPGAEVVAKRVFAGNGLTSDTDLAAALRALPADIHVINLSLGGTAHDNIGMPATEAALHELSLRWPRPVVVAAAGNEGANTPTFPAAFKGVIAVGASQDPGGGRACFSNHGSWVDACALGRGVHSTFFDKLEATPETIPPTCLADPQPGLQQFQGFATWSGTSFAAPCVAGAIAARMTEQNIDAVEAAFQLVYANGRPRHPSGDLGTIVACAEGGVD